MYGYALVEFHLFLCLTFTLKCFDQTEVIYAHISNKRKYAHLQMKCDHLVASKFAFVVLFACL